jgi:hypothetical protein
MFSLDIVSTVASYCDVTGIALEGTTPQLAFSFPWLFDGSDCVDLACSPDGDLWILDGVKIRVFTLMGGLQRSLDAPNDPESQGRNIPTGGV